MSAARYGRWIIDDAQASPSADPAELRRLLGELDRPLMPGFMTAGYSALGRYIFLAAENRRASRGPRPV